MPTRWSTCYQKVTDLCVKELIDRGLNKRMILLAPWMRAKASVLREEVENLERRGFQRLRIEERSNESIVMTLSQWNERERNTGRTGN